MAGRTYAWKNRKCAQCGVIKPSCDLKQGWTNCLYCSESCERSHVSDVHGSMPGGALPTPNWVPSHIAREIRNRWSNYER